MIGMNVIMRKRSGKIELKIKHTQAHTHSHSQQPKRCTQHVEATETIAQRQLHQRCAPNTHTQHLHTHPHRHKRKEKERRKKEEENNTDNA